MEKEIHKWKTQLKGLKRFKMKQRKCSMNIKT